jgi:hypothetical protein
MSGSQSSWDALADAWRSSEEARPAPDIGAELRKRRLLTLCVVLGEVGVTLGVIGVTLWLRGEATIGPDAVFLRGLWILWFVATCFAWWTRRGQWPQSVASSQEFVQLSLERAKRKKRITWFSLGLLGAQVGFAMYLSGLATEASPLLGTSFMAILVPIVAAHLVWALWYYLRAAREQEHFTALKEAFESEEQS